MFCKKCGAEIPEGAGFCEKCGNPVEKTPKQENNKKKWALLAISSSGVIILAVAIVGILFATGILGGKDEAVQADVDTVVSTEMPSVTEKAAGDTETDDQEGDVNATEDKAYEAYMAYKAFGEQEYNEYVDDFYNNGEDYDEDDGEYSSPSTWEEYDQYSDYAFVYLDGDDYPELILYSNGATVENKKLYTYDAQTGAVVDTGFDGTDISYLRKQGYIYDACRHSANWSSDCMAKLNAGEITELFSENYGNEEKDAYTRRQVAKKANVNYSDESEWSTPEFFSTLDEAYIHMLKENK